MANEQKNFTVDNVEVVTFYDGEYAEILIDNEVKGQIWGRDNLSKVIEALKGVIQ